MTVGPLTPLSVTASRRYTAQEAYIMALRTHTHVREVPAFSNWGQAVQAFLALCGISDPNPWCMAFLTYVGRKAFGAAWVIPRFALVNAFATWAKQQGIRMLPSEAQVGDAFVIWYPTERRFRHVGVICGPRDADGKWETIEGNTNDGGSREGNGVFIRRRALGDADRIIQWWRVIR